MATTSTSVSYALSWTIKCSSAGESDPRSRKLNKSSVKVNGTHSTGLPHAATKLETFSTSAVAFVEDVAGERSRQNIPTEKQNADPFRQGLIVEGGVGYRQTVVIRSYEVGPDKTATLETILNLLQETALNHVWMSGLLGDGFGATHGMIRNNLIWVVTRMHVQVDQYPIWGEVLEIDTWVGASGKNGMRRDCTWVMMNKQTRRLSKMPEEVRDEISPWFIERQAIKEDVPEKIIKLDDDAKYVDSDLKPKRSDLDMNHHVNNVKYVRWMLETIPVQFPENYELSSIILEYRRECGSSDTVQSICEPDEGSIPEDDNISIIKGFSLAPEILDGCGLSGTFDKWPTKYTHLLQIKGQQKYEEIVRGRTTWRKKLFNTY
ncbi:Palmitoyl-acyl carrier protein thioesterase, chloroplastic [Ananas comosus]|uniref:Acyl-[acyl-carrier-protein] hydrolase n=1 Tax=Ananas comosus TaxID=4615 RepID=A0A199VVN3_ANACO|nr:Palmitoyl-acyl carrier protein thioesterase, chloroplastic [Ananas comosus]